MNNLGRMPLPLRLGYRSAPSCRLTSAGPLVSLITGILILVVPRLLNYIVAIYLIVIGLPGPFGGHLH